MIATGTVREKQIELDYPLGMPPRTRVEVFVRPLLASTSHSIIGLFSEDAELLDTIVSVMEIVCGFQRAQRNDRLEQFLQSLSAVEVLPFDAESAVLAGRIDGDLWRTGQRVGRADPMIAAQAIVHDFVLVSGNLAPYQRIRALGYPLRVVNWREDAG